MKHELLIFISTLPCCLLFASVGIQLKEESNAPQPNVSVESTKERSSKPQEKINDQHALFSVPIQISHQPKTDRSVDQARNVRIHVTQNNSYHDIEVPFGADVDEDSPVIQKKLHDLIFENIKQGMHSRPKCEYTEGKKCDEGKKVNDVDLSEEHTGGSSKNKVIENFKSPVITIPRGSEIFPHHHHNSTDSETSHMSSNSTENIPLPEDEFPFSKSIPVNTPPPSVDELPIPTPVEDFPFNKSIPVNTAPTPRDEHPFTPAEEFPYNNSIPVDKAPNKFFPLPTTKSLEITTPKPTSNQSPTSDVEDGKQSHVALEVVIAIIFFGSICSILYYFYAGNIRSCNRRQRLIEDNDEEDGTRMEMNPRNNEENNEENNGENEENAPL